jgi:putative ABC transport system permease protein
MTKFFRHLQGLFQASRRDAELREEIEAHRALRREALERAGLTPADAERESRRALGNVTLAVEDARDVWAVRALDQLRQDLRTALRGLHKSPGFALVAVGTLALGIGANTALFSIFSSLVLRPLPVRDAGSLVLVADGSWTYPIWEQIARLDGEVFDGAIAWSEARFDLSRGGRTELVNGAFVSGRFFDVLDVTAARGRLLTPADDIAGSADGPVAVISYRLWQQHFGGASDIIGRSLTLERVPFTIVGVMPPGFFGVDVGRTADLIVPFATEPVMRGRESVLAERSTWWVEIMARVKAGQDEHDAAAAVNARRAQIREATLPDWSEAMRAGYLDKPFTFVPAATGKSGLRRRFQTPLLAMVVAVGLVLLVACANIASLLLARALARRHELSVRLALGASRGRLTQLLFIESLLLASAGAAIGLVFAKWSSALLVQQLTTWRGAIFLDLAIDWRVLAFTAGLACVSALVAGVAPVLGLKSVAAGEALKDAGRSISGDRRFAVRGTLVIAQVALSLVLIVAAGLFLRTFTTLSRVPLGFTPEPLLVTEIELRTAGIPADERGALTTRLLDAASAVPGVTTAAVSQMTPVNGGGWNNWVGDSPAPPRDRRQMTWLNAVTPGWFATMKIPLRGGRDFNTSDRGEGVMVAIVNESFVRRFLSDRQPIGATVHLGPKDAYQVIGVVGDAVYRNPREGMMPTLYLPLAQRKQDFSRAVLTVAAAPGRRAAVERDLAAALSRVDPSMTFTFRTFDELIDATVAQERLIAMLASFFGALALLLAGIGLYGIVAQAVRARESEIGLRLALGAQPASIVRLVLNSVALLVAIGLSIGLLVGVWAVRFLTPLLFEVEARDTATFMTASGVLIAVGALAAWLPARRAARLDPATVLRES